jgi:hypothetical protein
MALEFSRPSGDIRGYNINGGEIRMRITLHMKTGKLILAALIIFGFCSYSLAVESGMYRLLSLTKSEKLILVSQAVGKIKLLLDASSAKITVNGKPAEFGELKTYSIIQLKLDRKKITKNGIDLDGSATEIRISSGEEIK